jgi:tetratricopeptide (TPR) repeat protein
MALTLSRQGRFDEATAHWKRLLALSPKDEQAQVGLEIMQPSELQASDELLALKQAWMDEQGNKETGLQLAGALIAAGLFSDADTILADVQAAAGADLQVLEQREQLQLAKGIRRLSIARRWAALDSHAKSQKLVTQFAGEYQRLDIEIWNQRTDRMPKDWGVRLELARRLKQVGNFSGAIQRLEEAQRLKMNHPGAFLELGECWQHLRQFERALGMYEKAIAKAEMLSSNDEVLKLARYRAGVLGAALGQREFARHNFRAIVAADPLYKDTQERLDKLGLS